MKDSKNEKEMDNVQLGTMPKKENLATSSSLSTKLKRATTSNEA